MRLLIRIDGTRPCEGGGRTIAWYATELDVWPDIEPDRITVSDANGVIIARFDPPAPATP